MFTAWHASPLRPIGVDPGSLGAIAGSFKSSASREQRRRGLPDASPIWQRNYCERIIRSEAELNRIRESITANRRCGPMTMRTRTGQRSRLKLAGAGSCTVRVPLAGTRTASRAASGASDRQGRACPYAGLSSELTLLFKLGYAQISSNHLKNGR
jgi:hypothetical protein